MAAAGAEGLVADQQGLVRAFFARRCASPEDAEDLAQETFCALVEAWPSFRGESRPSTWVWALCRHVYARQLRSRGLRARSARLLAAEALSRLDSGVEESAERRLSLEILLPRLDGASRLLFHCLYERGLGTAETAALLGRPEGTIKYESFLLRRRLRALLDLEGRAGTLARGGRAPELSAAVSAR